MTRDEIINLLVEGSMWEFEGEQYLGDLRSMLRTGIKGYYNYSNQELKNELSTYRSSDLQTLIEIVRKKEKIWGLKLIGKILKLFP